MVREDRDQGKARDRAAGKTWRWEPTLVRPEPSPISELARFGCNVATSALKAGEDAALRQRTSSSFGLPSPYQVGRNSGQHDQVTNSGSAWRQISRSMTNKKRARRKPTAPMDSRTVR